MYKISLPTPLVRNPKGTEGVPFKEWKPLDIIENMIAIYGRVKQNGVKGPNESREIMRIYNALDKAEGKKELVLEDALQKTLKNVFAAAPRETSREALQKTLEIEDAIINAEHFDPNEKQEEKK